MFVFTESTLLRHGNIYKNKTPYTYTAEHLSNVPRYMSFPSFNAEFHGLHKDNLNVKISPLSVKIHEFPSKPEMGISLYMATICHSYVVCTWHGKRRLKYPIWVNVVEFAVSEPHGTVHSKRTLLHRHFTEDTETTPLWSTEAILQIYNDAHCMFKSYCT